MLALPFCEQRLTVILPSGVAIGRGRASDAGLQFRLVQDFHLGNAPGVKPHARGVEPAVQLPTLGPVLRRCGCEGTEVEVRSS